jgi:hypothetical protein
MNPVHLMFRTLILVGAVLVTFATCSGDNGAGPFVPPPPPPPPGAAPDIVVDGNARYQTVNGWEATAQAGQGHALFSQFRNALFEQAVNDLGITRLRVEVPSGIENTRDTEDELARGLIDQATYRCLRYATVNDDANPLTINPNGFKFTALDNVIEKIAIPMKQRLEARGERLFLNVTYVAFVTQIGSCGTYHHDSSPAEYAEFVLATYLHLRDKYGLVPDTWEVILEPDITPFWRGTQIGQAMVTTAALLAQNGFTARFIAPSTTNMQASLSFFDDMAQVPGALGLLAEYSYHRYSGVSEENLAAIGSRAQQHQVSTSMLEHIASGYEDLHADLKTARVSAWQQFTLAFPTNDDGAQYYLITQQGDVQMASRTRYLRQYFRYIRPGAVRIGATSSRAGFDPLAFRNASGKHVVVIKADAAGSVSIGGLPAGTYGITYTTAAATLAAQQDVAIAAGGAVTAGIPARGVISVFQR